MPDGARKPAWRAAARFLPWLPLVVFVAVIGFQLFGPIPFGLANNNDFARVLGPLGLWPAPHAVDAAHPTFTYFVNDYVETSFKWDSGVPSSEWLIAALAKRIAKVVLPPGTFQLRLMGFLHAAILTLALIIFLHALRTRALWVRCVAGLLLVFIWTDLRYAQYFNTAYTDAGAVMAFAVVFAVAIECLLVSARWFWSIVFVLSSCFLLATKTQHETTLPFLIAFCFFVALRVKPKRDRIAWLAAPAVLLGTSIWILENTPAEYRAAPAFTVVFYKLAVLSPDPGSVLTEFHMPEQEFQKYIGHYAYEPMVPIDNDRFRKRIVSLVTPFSLGRFYWRHPDFLRKVLLFDFRLSAPDVDLTATGTYGHLRKMDLRSGKRPFELRYWSRFRRRLFAWYPFHLFWLFGLVLLFTGFCAVSPPLRRLFPTWTLALISTLIAISSFLFASLLDAVETARHLTFFETATDFTMFSVVLCGLLAAEEIQKQKAARPLELRKPFADRMRLSERRTIWLAAFGCVAIAVLVFLIRNPGVRPANGDIDDTSSKIEYSGTWIHSPFLPAWNGTTSFSNDSAAVARLSFRGSEITWVYAKAYNRGIASASIDGVPVGEIDQYSPDIVWQARTRFAGLSPGKHVIEIKVSGRKDAAASDAYIDLDGFIVR